jgi:lipid-A-disaccharide synthase-like uncharacterized protein
VEEARQHPAVVPVRLAAAAFTLKMGEMLSALAVLPLAIFAPRHVFIAVNLFGLFVAVRSGLLLTDGLSHARIYTRGGPISRAKRPRKFWTLVALNAVVALVGIFLTQLPIR